jgi:hypothetical protein
MKIKYIKLICSVVLHACETLSLTLREKPRLKEFEIKVLRRIFGSKKVEIKGSCAMRSLIIFTPGKYCYDD